MLFLHMMAVLAFVLPRFGNLFTPDTMATTKDSILIASFYAFVVSNSFLFVTQMAKLVTLAQNIRCYYSTSPSFSILQDQVKIQGTMFDVKTCIDVKAIGCFPNAGCHVRHCHPPS